MTTPTPDEFEDRVATMLQRRAADVPDKVLPPLRRESAPLVTVGAARLALPQRSTVRVAAAVAVVGLLAAGIVQIRSANSDDATRRPPASEETPDLIVEPGPDLGIAPPVGRLPDPPLEPRVDPLVTWTGTELLVAGGTWSSYTDDHANADGRTGDGRSIRQVQRRDAAVYDPATNRWRQVTPPPVPIGSVAGSVWTGQEVVALVDRSEAEPSTNLVVYRPDTDRWLVAPLPDSDAPYLRAVVAWTGTRVLLWSWPYHGPESEVLALSFDPRELVFEAFPPGPLPFREMPGGVWTGDELIVFGGDDDAIDWKPGGGDGAAYNPSTNTWRRLAPSPLPELREPTLTWTGSEVLVVGGSSGPSNPSTAAAYDPARDEWRQLADSPSPGRNGARALWTGGHLYVIDGDATYAGSDRRTLRLDPLANSWELVDMGERTSGCQSGTAWTGQVLYLIGGTTGCGDPVGEPLGYWRTGVEGG